MLSRDEQLELWWDSLTAEQRSTVLDLAPDADPPGWIVASLAATNVRLDEDPATESAEDFKSRLPQAIHDLVARKRAER